MKKVARLNTVFQMLRLMKLVKLLLQYYQTRFSYEDGILKNSKASEQKRLADFINANADEIRKCIDARAKTDGELELTLTTGGEAGAYMLFLLLMKRLQ